MATITVKGIPDELYQKLKVVAQMNHRSVNGEIISLIESSLMPRRIPASQLLARVRRLHESFGERRLDIRQIDEARREGRP